VRGLRTGARARWSAALVVPLLLGVGACSEGDADQAVDQARDAASSALEEVEIPDVDWSQYGDDVRERIDKAAEEADCTVLRDSLNRYESTSNEVTEYIEAKLEEAGC
jgi:hypothetical protein